jgi:hypothetical protein
LGLRRLTTDPTARFVLGGTLAMAVMAAAHLEFTFARHQETGWLRGVSPRYYSLAGGSAGGVRLADRTLRAPARSWALAGVLIAATVAYDVLYRVQ